MAEQYRLEMIGVSKSFPGVKALDGINLKVRPGTVHALMGENGAGKSTLMKCLFGIYKMDEGQIIIDGEKTEITNPDDALARAWQWFIRNFSQYRIVLLQKICIWEDIP